MPVADHAAMAVRHMAVYGEPMTLRKTSAGTLSDATRSYSGETVTTYPLVGFVAPYKVELIDGSEIRVGDLEARFAAASLPAVIETGDEIERATKRYEVVSVDTRGAGGTGILVIVQMRGTQ